MVQIFFVFLGCASLMRYLRFYLGHPVYIFYSFCTIDLHIILVQPSNLLGLKIHRSTLLFFSLISWCSSWFYSANFCSQYLYAPFFPGSFCQQSYWSCFYYSHEVHFSNTVLSNLSLLFYLLHFFITINFSQIFSFPHRSCPNLASVCQLWSLTRFIY